MSSTVVRHPIRWNAGNGNRDVAEYVPGLVHVVANMGAGPEVEPGRKGEPPKGGADDRGEVATVAARKARLITSFPPKEADCFCC